MVRGSEVIPPSHMFNERKKGKKKTKDCCVQSVNETVRFPKHLRDIREMIRTATKMALVSKKSTVNHQSHIIESKCSGEVSNFPNIFYYVMYTNIHIYLYMQIMFSPIPRSKKSDDEVI